MKLARVVALSLLAGVALGGPLLAQEQPLVAGADGVPVPKKTKSVKPAYPAEALAQGLRGIVILDLLIDARGHVTSTTVVRSVPGLDEAAIAAARQWEYEPTKIDGKPVSVRLTVPITFTLALPALARDSGIPELRQGVAPAFPAGASEAAHVTAEVTLEGDGRVGTARVVEGNDPWAGALLSALQTWRFSPPPEDASISFRVEAQFAPARGSDPARVALRASGLQRSDMASSEPPPPQPQAAPAPALASAAPPESRSPAPEKTAAAPSTPPDAPPVATPPVAAQPVPAPPATAPAVAPPVSTASVGAPPAAAPPVAAAPAPNPPAASAAPAATAAARQGSTPPATPPAPPPVEVITAPAPPQPPENGVSAIRDVTLEPGVPDLTRGRRPVAPPLARMAGATGIVEVAFSVSAAGTTQVQSVSGPDLLKKAAEQAVASWVFRRTRADRAYLTATFSFAADKTGAVVKPQQAPAAGATPSPEPAVLAARPPAPAPTPQKP
jgi:TonB family protein